MIGWLYDFMAMWLAVYGAYYIGGWLPVAALWLCGWLADLLSGWRIGGTAM